MYTSGRLALSYAVLAALLSIPLLAADKPNETVPPAPIPSQILNAKNVFISNAGGNLHTLPAYIMSHTASPNGLYDQFYAAIKSWGKYELVSTPAEADLVLEISLYARDYSGDPQFELKVLDPKTRVILWAFVETVPAGSGREASRQKAWDAALDKLVNDFKTLALQPAAATVPRS
jgi:hypothetical protein